jgi:hypothetical protein
VTKLAADHRPDSCAHAGAENIGFAAGWVADGPWVRYRRGVGDRRRLVNGRVVRGCRTLDVHRAIHINRAIDIYRPIDYDLALHVNGPSGDLMRGITIVDRALVTVSALPTVI